MQTASIGPLQGNHQKSVAQKFYYFGDGTENCIQGKSQRFWVTQMKEVPAF